MNDVATAGRQPETAGSQELHEALVETPGDVHWHRLVSPESARTYVRGYLVDISGGFTLEVHDDEGTRAQQEALLDAVVDGLTDVAGTPTLDARGKVRQASRIPLVVEIGRPECESIDDAIARAIRPVLARRRSRDGVKALEMREASTSETYRRQRLSVAATAFAKMNATCSDSPVVLIAAAGAQAWMGGSAEAVRVARLATRHWWLRFVLIGAGAEYARAPRQRTWGVEVVRAGTAFDAARRDLAEKRPAGDALLEAICHDVAMEGGTAWRTKVSSWWPQSYVFRAGGRDDYQRSLSPEGAQALAHACGEAVFGSGGLTELTRAAHCDFITCAGGRARRIALVRQPDGIEINVWVRPCGRSAYRASRADLTWPGGGGLAHGGYGTCALDCVGKLLGHERTAESVALFEEVCGVVWDGQGATLEQMQAMLAQEDVGSHLARSAGETHMHCRDGGIAIIVVGERSHGMHGLLRIGRHLADPACFVGLGRLWADGDEDVSLIGALLISEGDPEWVGFHTQHFRRRPRPENARRKGDEWH